MKIQFALLLFFISLFVFSSCSKNTITNTVVKNDTLIVNDTIPTTPLSQAKILAQQSPWQIGEAFYDIGGVVTEYQKGGVNTTGINYSPVQFVFNSNQTGTYTDSTGTTYEMTWQFTTADMENMQLVTNQILPDTLNWSLVSITDSAVFLTNNISGTYIQSAKLIPVN